MTNSTLMQQPAISVIIPTYNPSDVILNSVRSALSQTVKDIEVIVVDDGSSVPVRETLRPIVDERLRITRQQPNRGVSAARNLGLSEARGNVVALLDDDDFWYPRHLEASMDVLDRTGAALIYGEAEFRGHPYGREFRYGEDEASLHPMNEISQLAVDNPIITSTVVARTEHLRACGGWPTWLRTGEDWWLYLELARAGSALAFQPEPLVVYEWPSGEGHATSADAFGTLVDRLRLARALYSRHSARDLPAFSLLVVPFGRYVIERLPWRVRGRLGSAARRVRTRNTREPSS